MQGSRIRNRCERFSTVKKAEKFVPDSHKSVSRVTEGISLDMKEEEMIAEIMSHLDKESTNGVYRMSVLMDENADEAKTVSKQCCNMYGRPASETVGLLDMYTDMNAGKPDNE